MLIDLILLATGVVTVVSSARVIYMLTSHCDQAPTRCEMRKSNDSLALHEPGLKYHPDVQQTQPIISLTLFRFVTDSLIIEC